MQAKQIPSKGQFQFPIYQHSNLTQAYVDYKQILGCTLTKGARQLVVHEALEMMGAEGSNCSSLTPMT